MVLFRGEKQELPNFFSVTLSFDETSKTLLSILITFFFNSSLVPGLI